MQNQNPQNKININLINSNNYNLPPGGGGYPMQNYPQIPGGVPSFNPNAGYQPYFNQYPAQANPQVNQGHLQVNPNPIPIGMGNTQPSVEEDKGGNDIFGYYLKFIEKIQENVPEKKLEIIELEKKQENEETEDPDKDKPKNSMLSYIYGGQL